MAVLDRLQRAFAIRMFFLEKDLETFYDIQPELVRGIAERWDTYRKEASKTT